MDGRAGGGTKLPAVRVHEFLAIYEHGDTPEDLQPERLLQIRHLFQHYRHLEPGKQVNVIGWSSPGEAAREDPGGVARYQRGPSAAEDLGPREALIKLTFLDGQGRGTLCAVTVTRTP